MLLDDRLKHFTITNGADYFGVADLLPAREAIFEQGGPLVAEYPRAVSIGIKLIDPIVDGLLHGKDTPAALSYKHHCYDVINLRLDLLASSLCSIIQPEAGPRVRWTTILTDAPLEPGIPMDERCGDCRKCVDICPQKAFTGRPFKEDEPRETRYDAGKCDRYFKEMEKAGRLAVCGLCLYVCPYGRQNKSH